MPTKIIGNAPHQAPRNSDLGSLAFQDKENINIDNGSIVLSSNSTQGYFQNTDVSDVKPSLTLDFANSKSLDARVSFTRGTVAFAYDGTSARAEENLIFPSANLASSPQVNAVNLNTMPYLTPDGNINQVTHFVPSATNDRHFARAAGGSTTVSLSVPYTFSFYAKSAGYGFVSAQITSGTSSGGSRYAITVDLSNGTIGGYSYSTNVTNTSARADHVGNGWYRVALTASFSAYNASSIATGYIVSAYSTNLSGATGADGAPIFTPDGVSGVMIWGLQLEQRDTTTLYTPTTIVSVTNYIPKLASIAAHTPRFDHDPITGECKGLLIEESRTNLLKYSQTIDGTIHYVEAGGYYNYATIAPDGSNTATAIVEGSTYYCRLRQDVTGLTNGGTYCYSVYAKAGTQKHIQMQIYSNSTNTDVVFDLANGVVSSISVNSGSSPSIVSVGNGWYRCSISAVIGSTTVLAMSYPANANGYSYSHTSGVYAVYVWGMQLEASSTPSTYIASVSNAQTARSADSATIYSSYLNNFYNVGEGTFVTTFKAPGSTAFPQVVTVSDGTTNNAHNIDVYSGGGIRAISTRIGTSDVVFQTANNGLDNTVAFAYKYNDSAFAVNGSGLQTDSTASVAVAPTMFNIGNFNTNQYYLNGTIKKIIYYPKRLANAELLELSL